MKRIQLDKQLSNYFVVVFYLLNPATKSLAREANRSLFLRLQVTTIRVGVVGVVRNDIDDVVGCGFISRS